MKNITRIFCSLMLIALSCDTYNDGYLGESKESGDYAMNYLEGDLSGENYKDYGENPFVSAENNPVSTFAIDADGGSYSNMRRMVNQGNTPIASAIRIEEFINYFQFNYPNPQDGNVSIHSEISECPWNTSNKLLRIGLKGKSLETRPPSNFVFLIDVSGSMNSADKLELLKSGFISYTQNLTANDRVAIVTYAGSAGVVLESTAGDKKDVIKAAINKLGAGGSTAGAQGLITAYKIAEQNLISDGNNRIIIGSDGDFNVGSSSRDELVELIEQKRDKGIYITVLGVGTGNYNDEMMEQIANNGNGTYEYIDSEEQLNKVFHCEYDKFFTVAKDCKIRIQFNNQCVDKYRLIGYANRLITEEEFEEDSTDAGEIGASQTITALYEISPKQTPHEKLGVIELRYKTPENNTNKEIATSMAYSPVTFSESTENQRFAASVAGLGLMLRDSEYKGNLTYQQISRWAESAISYDPNGFRNEFLGLVNKVSNTD